MSAKLTTQQFIYKANLVHKNKYNYSQSDYINNHTKLIIICKIHGEFLQTPLVHLSGCNCPKCVVLGHTINEFIYKSNLIHNNKYIYDKVQFKNLSNKIIIICPTHGEFIQEANNHINGMVGCKQCLSENLKNKLQLELVDKFKLIHNNKYNYENIKYINSSTQIRIGCHVHGDFFVLPKTHLNGGGCKKCLIKTKIQKPNLIENNRINLGIKFLKNAKYFHKDYYNYDLVIYYNAKTKVKINCPKHGEFSQTPDKHLQYGCTECGYEKTANATRTEPKNFIIVANKIHNNIYDYSKINYINSHTNIIIICPKHGEFSQTPTKHIHSYQGCPICKSPKGELAIINYLKTNNIKFITQKRFKDCKNINPLPFDFYLPETNTLIEYDGIQHYKQVDWFNNLEKTQINDNIKTEYSKINNIKLIRIPYWQYINIERILKEELNE